MKKAIVGEIYINEMLVLQSRINLGGDHDTEWEDNDEEQHMIMTNLSCPNCTAEVIVYHGNVDNAGS